MLALEELHDVLVNIVIHSSKSTHNGLSLTLYILMDFPIQASKIRMGLSIIYFKGSQVEISK